MWGEKHVELGVFPVGESLEQFPGLRRWGPCCCHHEDRAYEKEGAYEETLGLKYPDEFLWRQLSSKLESGNWNSGRKA